MLSRLRARCLSAALLAVALCVAVPAASARDLPAFSALVEQNRAAVVNIRSHRFDDAAGGPMRPRLPRHGYGEALPPGHPDPGSETPDRAQGSGFVISPDGYILTNAHVVAVADEVVVRMSDRSEYRAQVVGMDRRTDIALLKVPADGLPSVSLGDPNGLKEGDWVLAIGSPFGFEQSVTAGIVSAKARSLPYENFVPFIQTDVAINPGNSGGPLFNLKGEVVGINSQIFSRTGGFMGLAFSIPIDMAMDIQGQLRESGRVRRGRIGVVIQDVSPDIAGAFGLPTPGGALVSTVLSDAPAGRAGILQGDVILAFDGQPVDTSADLPRIVAATPPGSEVSMSVWREGEQSEVPITVGELRDDDDSPAPGAAPSRQGEDAHDRLGLVVVEPSLLQRRQMKIEQGVMIERRRGGAASAELQYGDVVEALIVAGRRKPVADLDAYRAALDALEPGMPVSLLVRRGRHASFVGLRADR
ncbi:MAG: Do family serine endopeptidase [Rhodocyclaceae bacterium]|nr:Do family serine endopeptidase [Rhodocyclaceae bacterium]